MIVPFVLSQLVARCAPSVGPVTMSAVVEYESGANPYAIGDNTARRSYSPGSRSAAVAIATDLLSRGHNIDAGYAQVNSGNFRAYGLSATSAFDPCTNVAVGAHILRGDYASAARAYGPGQIALVHALSAYNTGGYWGGLRYARNVYAIASRLRYERGSLGAGFTTRGPAMQRAVAFRPLHASTLRADGTSR